jgi:hypothetical protein
MARQAKCVVFSRCKSCTINSGQRIGTGSDIWGGNKPDEAWIQDVSGCNTKSVNVLSPVIPVNIEVEVFMVYRRQHAATYGKEAVTLSGSKATA